jgi:DNA mismatch repair protein MutS2
MYCIMTTSPAIATRALFHLYSDFCSISIMKRLNHWKSSRKFSVLLLLLASTITTVSSYTTSSSTSSSCSQQRRFFGQKQILAEGRHHGFEGHLHSSNPRFSAEADARAGTDGYSLQRQPVSWKTDEDPVFDVPTTLREEDEKKAIMQEDSLWWSNNIKGIGMNRDNNANDKKATKKQTFATPSLLAAMAQDDDLDLYQRSLDTLDFPKVLKALMQECSTVPARQIVQEATHFHNLQQSTGNKKNKVPKKYQQYYTPLVADSFEGVQQRYRAVQEMEWLVSNGNDKEDVRLDQYTYRNRKGYKEFMGGRGPPLNGISFNLQAIMDITDAGKVLEGPEILEVSSIMDALEDVVLWSQALQKIDALSFVELPAFASGVAINTTLHDLLHNAFDSKGRLSGTTFPDLGALRERVRTFKANIMQTLDSLLAMPSMQSKLALDSGGSLYSEVSGGRLVIPVASKYATSIGIVHDKSRSEKTVYVEPTEIVGPTNELRQAESELRQEEARVWRSLTEQILHNRVELEASVTAVGQLDLVMARLLLGRKLDGVIPLVKDEGVVALRDAKHPVLLLRELDNVVGSDIDLGADGNQGLVLTGPNAGGKTVILKLIGLIALMSRGGIPVPAAGSASGSSRNEDNYVPRVDFFDPVLADIGDLQSVGGDLSTFSGHMLVCREILSNAGKNSLVMMDELGSGTDPNQGVAIAQALMEALLETGARVVITTHYLQLKQLAASDDRFAVAGMQFVNGKPTYKLLPGTVGESFALAVAERLKLPAAVIERANELLDSETRQMGDLIRELEDQRSLLDQKIHEIEEKKKEMAALEFQIKEEKIRLEKKQLTARRDEASKFAKKLEEKEKVLEDILERLKQDPSRRLLAKSWEDIKFVKRDALTDAENVGSVMARKQKAADAMEDARIELVPMAEMREKPDLQPGDKLIICQPGSLFGRDASVVSFQRNRVTVQVSGVTMGLKLTDVAIPPRKGGSFQISQTVSAEEKSSTSRAADKALQAEQSGRRDASGSSSTGSVGASSSVVMRMDSNTVDVRGCNLQEAQEMAKAKFSSALMSGRPVVYILHGHGTGGVLKSKIRSWLKTERTMVKNSQPADKSDGGDAFTRVELK